MQNNKTTIKMTLKQQGKPVPPLGEVRRGLKGDLLGCKRSPFIDQNMVFCNTIRNILIIKKL